MEIAKLCLIQYESLRLSDLALVKLIRGLIGLSSRS
jgi:hypothetical protein